jgi:hypothetical protein
MKANKYIYTAIRQNYTAIPLVYYGHSHAGSSNATLNPTHH